jgi:hypothetical protein
MRYTDEQILWTVFFLRSDAYMRMEPYLIARLAAVNHTACSEDVKKVMDNIDAFFGVLAQSYGDLNKARTSKLQLMELK